MKPNNRYNFKEAQLGPDFAKDKMADFKKMIEAGISFVATSMPGVGASYFLKYLAMQNFARFAESRRAYFIHVDLYNLPTLNQHEFYRMFLRDAGGNPSGKSDEQVFIETREILKKLATQHEKVAIIFSRFDQLKKDFDENFLSNLQSLTTIALGKIVLIFTSIKPLDEIAPQAVSGGNLTFYSKMLYFKPYSPSDLKKLLKIEPEPINVDVNLDKLIELSGGHNQLLHILLNSQKQNNLLLDKFVKMQLKDLIDYLDYQQRKQVRSIATHPERLKGVEGSIDEYLLGVGMVKKTDDGFKLFSPLLEEYIRTNLPVKLPVKEARLFKLLRKNMGSIVSKDEIFTEVWEGQEEATNWALDALIYRLRKHPFMQSHGYIIESHKKVGYTLIQT
ncbi:helix-turn-helix domain-containing protein [Candidatus Microgenomates bacterium]|nr:helix-turn-helix domain-containing protein [Candidatus Microgenomates bacterium]